MAIYYKVVKANFDGNLTSAVVHPGFVDFHRYYRKDGEIQKVSNGLAFTNLQQAKLFMKQNAFGRGYELWECTGRPIKLPSKFVLVAMSSYINEFSLRDLKRFLFHGAKQKGYAAGLFSSDNFPEGSIRLRDLKLTKKIQVL